MDPLADLDAYIAQQKALGGLTNQPVPKPRPQVTVGQVEAVQPLASAGPALPRPRPVAVEPARVAQVEDPLADLDAYIAQQKAAARGQNAGLAVAAGAFSPVGQGDSTGQAETAAGGLPSGPTERPPLTGTMETLYSSMRKGVDKQQAGFNRVVGLLTGDQEYIDSYFIEAAEAQSRGSNPELEARLKALNDKEGWAYWSGIFSDPEVVANMGAESVAGTLVPTMTGIVGAAAGLAGGPAAPVTVPAGAATGLGMGILLTEADGHIRDFLQMKGFDPENRETLIGLSKDPEMKSQMLTHLAKVGIPSAAIQTAATMLGGKLGQSLAKAGMVKRGVAAAAVSDAVGAGTAEATTQVQNTGRIDFGQVAVEATMELLLGGPIEGGGAVASYVMGERAGRRATPTPLSDDEIAARTPQDVPEFDAEGVPLEPLENIDEAVAQGRTLVAWVDRSTGQGKLRSYEEAEADAGASPDKSGRLVAVRPEDVEVPSLAGAAAQVDFQSDAVSRLKGSGPLAGLLKKAWGMIEAKVDTSTDPKWKVLEQNYNDLFVKDRGKYLQELGNLGALEFKGDPRASQVGFRQIRYAGVDVDPNALDPMSKLGPIVRGTTGKGGKFDLDLNKVEEGALVPRSYKPLTQAFERFGEDKFRSLVRAKNDPADVDKFIQAIQAKDTSTMMQMLLSEDLLFRPSELTTDYLFGWRVTKDPTLAATLQKAVVANPAPPNVGKPKDKSARTPDIWKISTGYDTPTAVADAKVSGVVFNPALKKRYPWAEGVVNASVEVMNEIITRMKLPLNVVLTLTDLRTVTDGAHFEYQDTNTKTNATGIVVNLEYITERVKQIRKRDPDVTVENFLKLVIAHEFGHYIGATGLLQANPKAQTQIFAAYRRMVAAPALNRNNALEYVRLAGINEEFRAGNPTYIMSFEEWWAEQVARWVFSNRRPIGVVERVAQTIAQKFKTALAAFKLATPNQFEAATEVQRFLNTMYDGTTTATYANAIEQQLQTLTRAMNGKVDPDAPAHMSAEGVPIRNLLEKLDLKRAEAEAQARGISGVSLSAVPAGVDKFNKFMKWALSLQQIANENTHIAPLQEYRELVQLAKLETDKIMVASDQTLRNWRRLGKARGARLGDFLFAMTEMDYLPAAERANGVVRQPTPAEFTKLARDHKVDAEMLQVYEEISGSFQGAMDRYLKLLEDQANGISDPDAKAARLKQLIQTRRQLMRRPYFPMNRFGTYTLSIYNDQGKLEYFELFESKRQANAAERVARRDFPETLGYSVRASEVPEKFQSLIGLPSVVLAEVEKRLTLTPKEKQRMEELKFDLAPSQSFRKRFMHRKEIPGYSTDAQRSFAHYFFHHARHYSRVKYIDLMQERVSRLLVLAKNKPKGRKAMGIYNFVADHMEEFWNPTNDLARIRSAVAIYWLGFSPTSALVNLTQTPLVTYPFLASKFGDAKAIYHIKRATLDVRGMYSGRVKGNPQLDKALQQAMSEGILNESRAVELVALSEGAGILASAGQGTAAKWQQLSSLSMAMFTGAEMLNRRVAFRAGWNLAMNNPGAKYLKDLDLKFPLLHQQLVDMGWSAQEATAYMAAKDTVGETQFQYARHARPRFMRGKAATLFTFFTFTQNMLYLLGTNKRSILPRYMLVMAFLGGLQGAIPGSDDINDLIKAFAGRVYGKHFDLEKEARRYLVDVVGPDWLDTVMHGVSRTGFGVPALAQMLGATWFPDVDLSGSVSLRNISPIKLGFLNPGQSAERATSEALQGAAGAAFGLPLALAQTLLDQSLSGTDLKTWERVVPRALRGVMKAYRYGTEGEERDRKGAVVTAFDWDDPEGRAEIIATALGFTPTRLSQNWDYRMAKAEAEGFWDIRRQLLVDRMFRALEGRDSVGDVMGDIRQFNNDLPYKEKAIRASTLKKSYMTRKRQNILRGLELPETKDQGTVTLETRRLFPDAIDQRALDDFE